MFKEWEEGQLICTEFADPWSDEDAEAYLASLASLAERSEPFVLLSVLPEEMAPMAQAYRARQAKIFKKIKSHLQEKCLAMLRVRPNGRSRADDETMSKGFGWPVRTLATMEEGRAHARSLLGK